MGGDRSLQLISVYKNILLLQPVAVLDSEVVCEDMDDPAKQHYEHSYELPEIPRALNFV